jgi:HD-like signal output (HDOD) protein
MMEGAVLSIESFEQRALASGVHFPFGSRVLEYLVTLVNDPEATAARLSAVVGWNPALTRSVAFQVSTTYGFHGRPHDIDLAVAALGCPRLRETLKRTVAHIATHQLVFTFEQSPEVWNHMIACALIARILASRFGTIAPRHAFIAGLVHDVGFLILGAPEPAVESPDASHWTVDDDIVDPEKTKQVALHEEAGLWMVARWETLPAGAHDAVRHHHTPGRATTDPKIASLVHVADVLCHRMYGGPLGLWPALTADPNALALLCTGGSSDGSSDNEALLSTLQGLVNDSLPSLSLRVAVVKQSIVEGLEGLPENERLVLALHYCEGISMRSIAGVLDETPGGVMQIHGNAMRHLTTALTDVGEEL